MKKVESNSEVPPRRDFTESEGAPDQAGASHSGNSKEDSGGILRPMGSKGHNKKKRESKLSLGKDDDGFSPFLVGNRPSKGGGGGAA